MTQTLLCYIVYCLNIFVKCIENDLDQDLFVCLSDSFDKHNRLFENDGLGNLSDIYQGTSGMPNDTVPSFCAAVGDYDNDGWLDVLVWFNYI